MTPTEAPFPAELEADLATQGIDLVEARPAHLEGDPAAAVAALEAELDAGLPRTGAVLGRLVGHPDDAQLAAWRNAFWPWLHLVAIWRAGPSGSTRETLSGVERVGGETLAPETWLGLRRREWVLSPAATTVKFDKNAAAWNGFPGTPGYGHYRWMRRFVGCFAPVPRGARILDFGSGTGWCGIEAAKRGEEVRELCAFDPSPEMVRIAEENAAREGIAPFTGRVGFGDEPPFPAEGEEPFDLVISSGVVSFAPDFDRWMEGLVRSVRPGGTLVLGDIHNDSRGMRTRRRRKPLVPARELNGCPRERARAWLEARGFRTRASAGYQLTTPIPEIMHLSERRLRGALSPLLLLLNRAAAGLDRRLGLPGATQFDSWVLHLERGAD